MKRNHLDVEHLEVVSRKERGERRQRKVEDVLVIDRVELAPADHLADVRDLDEAEPLRRQDRAQAGGEAVDVGHVGHHVVGMDDGGRLALGDQPLGEVLAEELRDGGDPSLARDDCDVLGGLDAEDLDPDIAVVLQEVPVVARDLDDEIVRAERALGAGSRDEISRVRQHRVREGREVHVVAEQELGRHRIRDLQERTPRAIREIEGVTRLVLGQLGLGQQLVRERCVPEAQHGRERSVPAGATGADGHGRGLHATPRKYAVYHSMVRFSPSVRSKAGDHSSIRLAFCALKT